MNVDLKFSENNLPDFTGVNLLSVSGAEVEF